MNINSSLLERNEEFLRNKSEKLKQYKTKNDDECTFSPKVNSVNSKQNEDEISVGERLFNYQSFYKNNIENIKENLKVTFPFKPDINPNTYDILKNRDAMLNEIKVKYDLNRKTKNFPIGSNDSDKIVNESQNEVSANSQLEGYYSERIKKIPSLSKNT